MFGWVGDRVANRQTPFVLGLAFLAGATLCFVVGCSVIILLIARLLQGFSSAVVYTFGSALLLERVGHEQIGQAMGYTGVAMTAGLLLGPVIGGILYEFGGYSVVFLVPVGMLIIEIVLRLLVIDKNIIRIASPQPDNTEAQDNERGAMSPDFNSQCTTPAQYITSKDGHPPFSNGIPISDENENEPLLKRSDPFRNAYIKLLASPRFITANLSLLILNGLACGFDAILPAYGHDAFGLTTSQVSLLFLIMGVPMLLAPVSGWTTDRFGPKLPAIMGLMLMTPALFSLRFATADSDFSFLKLSSILFIIGVAFSQVMTPLQTEASATVKEIEYSSPGIFGTRGAYSQAYGLMSSAFALGSM